MLCGCGNTFQTRSTKEGGRIVVEVCSQCHPFYTGKQKILDSGGRVARFEKRYGKRKGGAARRTPTSSWIADARTVRVHAQAGRRFAFAGLRLWRHSARDVTGQEV